MTNNIKIDMVDEERFLYYLNANNNKTTLLSIKTCNKFLRLVIIAIKTDEGIYCVNNFIDFKHFLKKLNLILKKSNNKIVIYDSKDYYKLLINNGLIPGIIYNLISVKLLLYDKNGSHYNIDDLIDKEHNKSLIDFYSAQFNVIPYQVWNNHHLLQFVTDELINIYINCSDINIQSVCNKRYIKLFQIGELAYAHIECNKICLDNNMNNDISRYFVDYEYNNKYAQISYNFTKTKTGRLSSSFHNFPVDTSDIIISRFNNGYILSADLSAYELRSLFYTVNASVDSDDIYNYISESTECDRSIVKNNIIKWMYGASNVDEKIINFFNEKYHVDKLIDDFFRDVDLDNLSYISIFEKSFKYDQLHDLKFHLLNHVMQHISSCLFIKLVYILNYFLIERKMQSKIIATIYDEIFIDIFSDDECKLIQKTINTILLNQINNKKVRFVCKFATANNMKNVRL